MRRLEELATSDDPQIAGLAERLEVSERTVYRDIRDLVLSGVPIAGEAGVGYSLSRSFDLPPPSGIIVVGATVVGAIAASGGGGGGGSFVAIGTDATAFATPLLAAGGGGGGSPWSSSFCSVSLAAFIAFTGWVWLFLLFAFGTGVCSTGAGYL